MAELQHSVEHFNTVKLSACMLIINMLNVTMLNVLG
jgi:hypothetical protein